MPFSEAIDIDNKKPRELRKYSGNSFPVTVPTLKKTISHKNNTLVVLWKVDLAR